MKEYTAKQIKQLEKNPYVFKVTKHMIYYTAKFKEDFWIRYQAGDSPRKIIADLGYNPDMFGQKRIDSLVQKIKKQALSGEGFTEGPNRTKRLSIKKTEAVFDTPQSFEQMQHELLYLRQEVEFLKKILKQDNLKRKS